MYRSERLGLARLNVTFSLQTCTLLGHHRQATHNGHMKTYAQLQEGIQQEVM